MIEAAKIEFQDVDGIWKAVLITATQNAQVLITRMTEVARMYPGKRIRATSLATGRLLDLLN